MAKQKKEKVRTNLKEERVPAAGIGTIMSKKSSTETVKMTLYISKPVVKEFKKLAIDKEKDYSTLATEALHFYVQQNQPEQSPPSH
jgi:hypothetical protein